jgi:hypothetical protein
VSTLKFSTLLSIPNQTCILYIVFCSSFIRFQFYYFKDKAEVQENGDAPHVVRPTCLKWYPDNMAWQLNLTRKDIRRQEIYFKLHNFLISEQESGKRMKLVNLNLQFEFRALVNKYKFPHLRWNPRNAAIPQFRCSNLRGLLNFDCFINQKKYKS